MGKLTSDEKAATRELKAVRKELEARFPGDEEQIERELSMWVNRQERRAEEERLAAEDQAAWSELSPEMQDAWTAIYMNRETAVREVGRVSRQRGGGSMFSGRRPSRFAPLRARPRIGP